VNAAVLFLDVDGPLNPYAAPPHRRPPGYQTHRMRPAGWEHPRKPLRVWLNPAHGPALLGMPFDLVWATTWGAQANEWIGPQIGLPELPHVEWSNHAAQADGTYFKTRDLVAYAAADGRPWAWVDDEIGDADREFVASHHQGPALLHHVNPRLGLQAGDFAALAEWAANLPIEEGAA
jgi:hypothetical protein